MTTYYAIKYYAGHNLSRGPWVTAAVTTDRDKAFRIRKHFERLEGHSKVFVASEETVRVYLGVGNKLW